MTRRALVLLALLATALLAAGCGGSKSSGSATDQALSFIPKTAPLVVTVNTDPNGQQWKNVNALLAKFPGSGAIKNQLKQGINSSRKVDYDADVKPILGNELVFASPRPEALQGSNQYLLAIKPKDEGKAKKLVDSDPKVATVDGTDIHRSSGGTGFTALKDGVLVSASTQPDLEAALQRHGGSDHMTSADLDKLTAGVGGDALVRIGANVQALISTSPRSATARKVKWVAALRDFGETISAEQDGLQSSFKLTTDGSLSPADLPLATGPQSPAVVRRAGEIGFGIRNIAQTWHFAESVAQFTSPAGYAKYLKQKTQASKQLGVNIDRDVIGQFTGDATVSVSLDGKVAFRSGVRDPAALQATLRKAAPRLAHIDPKKNVGVSIPKGGKGFYAVAQPNGKKVVFGVVGGNFVAANDALRAAQIAGESPSPVAGAKGAAVIAFDTKAVVNRLLQMRGQGAAAALLTGALGDFVSSAESETSGLSGGFKLTVK